MHTRGGTGLANFPRSCGRSSQLEELKSLCLEFPRKSYRRRKYHVETRPGIPGLIGALVRCSSPLSWMRLGGYRQGPRSRILRKRCVLRRGLFASTWVKIPRGILPWLSRNAHLWMFRMFMARHRSRRGTRGIPHLSGMWSKGRHSWSQGNAVASLSAVGSCGSSIGIWFC